MPTPENHISDPRIALCLSGGGFRAALFHLGAMRRLNELGVLSKIDTIASVSGGSILAAHLATCLCPWPEAGTVVENWAERVEQPFREFVRRNIRTGPILRRLLPWNWFQPSTQVKALQACYEKHLTTLRLSDLPDRPKFIFCGTDMTYGVSWVFERERVGSYESGYIKPVPDWPIALAVAASSCFPPVFNPMPIKVPAGAKIEGGDGKLARIGMSVSDGGLYDNLGLQPLEKCGTILCSDGGLPFAASAPHGGFSLLKAYLDITSKQAGAIRKCSLIAEYERKVRNGTYWGIGSAVERYRKDAGPGYSKELATSTIATIRTDMDAFSEAEIAVLENHGYLLADVALHVHAKDLISVDARQVIPCEDWMDEGRVREALAESGNRWWLGRF